MSPVAPDWQPFSSDGDGSWYPEPADEGTVVALVAPAAASRDQWATGLAVRLADAWNARGLRVVLAEGEIEYPTLHRELGVENGEGWVDAVLFGASVIRVARAVPDHGFFLVSAGSPSGDARSLVDRPRVGRLTRAFREAGVTLVLFLRDGGSGTEALIEEADDVVVLRAPDGRPPRVLDTMAGKVRWVTGPARSEPADGSSAPDVTGSVAVPAGVPAPDPDEHVMDFSADTSGGAAAEGAPVEPDDAPDTGAGDETEPPRGDAVDRVEDRPPPRRPAGADPHGRRKLMWVAIVVLLLIILVVLGALRSA